ncbi:MAG: hypothetical protein K0M46_00225 [Thiobacillus sp.]|nr:hypothetical protein [Thiobacillus sp.]
MSKQILWLAGAALLFAGAAQADATEAQADKARTTIVQKEASAPTASDAAADPAGTQTAKAAGQELHPDAKPVYLSGEDCGSN